MTVVTSSVRVEPTGGPLGAVVHGVDLSVDQDGDTVFAILEAFRRHVRTHPDTGRRSLYVSYLTAGIEGMSEEESRRTLGALLRHVDDDRYYWTHRWRPGDVVVWDNRCTNHKRTAFDPAERRVLHRVQIAGTRPF